MPDDLSHYTEEFSENDDGWYEPKCVCGKTLGIFPDAEVACDALMEHAFNEGYAQALRSGTPDDALWLEVDDDRRVYVGADGVRHIPAGMNARCGAGPLVVVLRPEEEIEFRCNLCWPSRADGHARMESLAAFIREANGDA